VFKKKYPNKKIWKIIQSQENKIPVPSARKKISFKNDDILL